MSRTAMLVSRSRVAVPRASHSPVLPALLCYVSSGPLYCESAAPGPAASCDGKRMAVRVLTQCPLSITPTGEWNLIYYPARSSVAAACSPQQQHIHHHSHVLVCLHACMRLRVGRYEWCMQASICAQGMQLQETAAPLYCPRCVGCMSPTT